jgi:hypothetical protein
VLSWTWNTLRSSLGIERHRIRFELWVLVLNAQKQTNILGLAQGTKQYMAVEVLSLEYLFQPDCLDPYDLGWSHNPLHDVESTWWITVWILYNLTEIEFSDEDKSHRAKLFSTADPKAREAFFRRYITGSGFRQKLPATISAILARWRMALINFYKEQQLDLEHGSHILFNYDEVITDAIGRIDDIRGALIDLAVEAPNLVPLAEHQ